MRPFALLLLVFAVPLALLHVEALGEAYGEGPPYYGRTTNMDKWSSPIPLLGAVDGLTLLVVTALAWGSRSPSSGRGREHR